MFFPSESVYRLVICFSGKSPGTNFDSLAENSKDFRFTSVLLGIQVPSAVSPLPWTQNAPKPRPMDSLDRTAHDVGRPIRGLQDLTSLRRSRNHLLCLTIGPAPSTLQSLITQQILTQLHSHRAKTTANYVSFTLILLRLLYTKYFQSRSPSPILRGECVGAQLRQILHFCTEVSETCQLLRTPNQPFSG